MSPRPTDIAAPFDDHFRGDPHGVLAWYRERRPVAKVLLPNGLHAWLLTRYADVRRALGDGGLVSDVRRFPRTWEGLDWQSRDVDMLCALGRNLSNTDAPDHEWLRAPAIKAFAPRTADDMRPLVRERATRLLAAAGDEFDALADYAIPLAVASACDVLGVPEGDRGWFETFVRLNTAVDLDGDAEALRAAAGECTRLFAEYATGDTGAGLIAHLTEVMRGDAMPTADMVTFLVHIFVASTDTTAMLVGNVVNALARDPGLLAACRTDACLRDRVVEEVIRFDGPARMGHWLFAAEPVEYGGRTIPTGDLVLVCLHSANRDPEKFPRPDELDPGRDLSGHLGFSRGTHFCTGAALARVEAQEAVGALVEASPEIALAIAPDELVRRSTLTVNGFCRVPMRR